MEYPKVFPKAKVVEPWITPADKAKRLRALATLGMNTKKLHVIADALAKFNGGDAEELRTITTRIEMAFEELQVPDLLTR